MIPCQLTNHLYCSLPKAVTGQTVARLVDLGFSPQIDNLLTLFWFGIRYSLLVSLVWFGFCFFGILVSLFFLGGGSSLLGGFPLATRFSQCVKPWPQSTAIHQAQPGEETARQRGCRRGFGASGLEVKRFFCSL